MFPKRYFPPRYYAPRYFPVGGEVEVPPVEEEEIPPAVVQTGGGALGLRRYRRPVVAVHALVVAPAALIGGVGQALPSVEVFGVGSGYREEDDIKMLLELL